MKEPRVIKENHKIFLETAYSRIIDVITTYPEKEFSLSDLAKSAHVAKQNMGKLIDVLKQEEFITVEKLETIWRIRANRESTAFKTHKRIRNFVNLQRSGVTDILNKKYGNPKAIIFFGSYRKGEDLSTSDIDIAIDDDKNRSYTITRIKELEKEEKYLHRKIQIHLFDRKTVDINVFNNIANGIVLTGFLEVRP